MMVWIHILGIAAIIISGITYLNNWFVSLDKVATAVIPEKNETQAYKNHMSGYAAGATPAGDGFMNIPAGIDEELPFN